MNPEQMNSRFQIKKWPIVLLVVLAMVAYFLYFISTRSFLVVSVNNSSGGDLSYSISSSGGSEDVSTKESSIKRFVKKGAYQAVVRDGYTSGVATTTTKGFLQTTQISVELKKEKSRTYVGDSPKQCMIYRDILISWKCYGQIDSAVKHLPATDSLPSYSAPIAKTGETITIESFVDIGPRLFILSKVASAEETAHVLYPVDSNNNFSFDGGIELKDLSGDKSYGAAEYGGGWLLYSLDGTSLLYYPSLTQAPSTINNPGTSVDGLSLYSVQVKDGSVALVYNLHSIAETVAPTQVLSNYVPGSDSNEAYDEGGEINRAAVIKKTEVVVLKDGAASRFELNVVASQVRLCGSGMLCVLSSGNLDIYSTTDGKLSKKHTFFNIDQIDTSGNNLLAVDKTGLMLVDPSAGSGSYLYTFNDRNFCGLLNKNVLGVCINNAGRESLLVLGQDDLVYPIDQYASDLSGLSQVDSVSIYKNYIYISPNFGELSRNQTTNRLEYDPKTKDAANTAIANKIIELNLAQAPYIVKQTVH